MNQSWPHYALGMERTDRVRQKQIDWFMRRGVEPLALVRDFRNAMDEVTVHRVVFDRDERWFEFEADLKQPSDEAVEAFVFAAHTIRRVCADLVAWDPVSGRVASLCRQVGLLGEEQIHVPRLSDDTVLLHPDPLSWLRAWRRGLVIVHWELAHSVLLEASPIECTTVDLAEQLQDLMLAPPPNLPRILVTDPEEPHPSPLAPWLRAWRRGLVIDSEEEAV